MKSSAPSTIAAHCARVARGEIVGRQAAQEFGGERLRIAQSRSAELGGEQRQDRVDVGLRGRADRCGLGVHRGRSGRGNGGARRIPLRDTRESSRKHRQIKILERFDSAMSQPVARVRRNRVNAVAARRTRRARPAFRYVQFREPGRYGSCAAQCGRRHPSAAAGTRRDPCARRRARRDSASLQSVRAVRPSPRRSSRDCRACSPHSSIATEGQVQR